MFGKKHPPKSDTPASPQETRVRLDPSYTIGEVPVSVTQTNIDNVPQKIVITCGIQDPDWDRVDKYGKGVAQLIIDNMQLDLSRHWNPHAPQSVSIPLSGNTDENAAIIAKVQSTLSSMQNSIPAKWRLVMALNQRMNRINDSLAQEADSRLKESVRPITDKIVDIIGHILEQRKAEALSDNERQQIITAVSQGLIERERQKYDSPSR